MSKPPELGLLLKALCNLKWAETKRLAIQLGVEYNTLCDIEKENSSVNEFSTAAMNAWLTVDLEATWNKLVHTLKGISQNRVAAEIEAKYCTKETLKTLDIGPPEGPTCTRTGVDDATRASLHDVSSSSTQDNAVDLDCKYYILVAKTKSHCQIREMSDDTFFLRLKNMFLRLQQAIKHEHRHYLKDIEKSRDVDDMFEMIEWKYPDFSLLEDIVNEFGSRELQEEVKKYTAALIQFEKKTIVQNFPSPTSLYQLRQQQESLMNCDAVQKHVGYFNQIRTTRT